MIGTQLTFTSDYFLPIPDEESETNPGIYGKALAKWFADQLCKQGVAIEGIYPEDFGWVIVVTRSPFLMWYGCGNTDESTSEWHIFPVVEASFFQRWMRKTSISTALESLSTHLKTISTIIPAATNITFED